MQIWKNFTVNILFVSSNNYVGNGRRDPNHQQGLVPQLLVHLPLSIRSCITTSSTLVIMAPPETHPCQAAPLPPPEAPVQRHVSIPSRV